MALAVTARPGSTVEPAALRVFLAHHLPKHMVPSSIHVLSELPLTASGKVARERVRALLENMRQ